MANSTNNNDIIDQCHLRLLDFLKNFSDDLMKNIATSLEDNLNKSANNKQHTLALECVNIYAKSKNLIHQHFLEQLSSGFKKYKTNELNTQIRENEFHKEAWSLVDDDILEETICIRTLSTEINSRFNEKTWLLEQRLTFLNKGLPINETSNPLSPLQFFSALRFGLKRIPLDISGKITSYKTLSSLLINEYAGILSIINNFLAEEDILPELNYTGQHKSITKKTSSSSSAGSEIDHSNDNPQSVPSSEENITSIEEKNSNQSSSQIALVNTIRNLLQRARNIGSENTPIPILQDKITDQAPNNIVSDAQVDDRTLTQQPIIFDASQIAEAVNSIQDSEATAHFFDKNTENTVLTTPTNIAETSTKVYQKLASESSNGAINAQNMYTIDMVGMLFEYILSDKNLPDSIKTLLSHLHTPFLKLAFIDESFFENREHKSRMLLDSLADAGANFVSHDGTSQYNMYHQIKHVVQRVIKEFENDVTLFAELLMEFNMLKKRITHMHNLKERNSIEKKQGQHKHEQAKDISRKAIKERIKGKRVPSVIIELLSPWFVYLTFIQLKEGNDSKKWANGLAVIDNIILYCSLKQSKENIEKIDEGFDKIIKYIEKGLTSISYNPAKSTSILQEVTELKMRVINKQTFQTTFTEADTSTTEEEATDNNTDADIPTPEEERVMNYIKLIEPGTWIEYEKTARLKVNKFNSESRKYILINQSNQDVIMLTRLELARDILSEKATVLDGTAKPLFERALERIKLNLDKQMQVADSNAN